MNLDDAQRWRKRAAILAFASAGFTLMLIFIGRQFPQNDFARALSDPLNLFDVVIVAACGIGVLRYSRTAAIALLCYSVISRIIFLIEFGRVGNLGLAIVFLFVYWQGIRATFAYHRLNPVAPPGGRGRKWLVIGLSFAGFIVLILIVFGLLVTAGFVPNTAVLAGEHIPQRQLRQLLEREIIDDGEDVLMFYSDGWFSIMEDGNILTDKRVISYAEIDGDFVLSFAPLESITDVIVRQYGDWVENTIIEVWTVDEDWFQLYLSTENGGDTLFINELRERTPLETFDEQISPSI